MSEEYFKMTGSGNDFIALDGRITSVEDWPAERIRAVCDRRNGIGADGLIILSPAGPGDARMTFFNNDGSRAPMCGNGALCTTRLAAELEIAPASGMTLVTDAGSFRTRCVGAGNLAELNLPDTTVPKAIPIPTITGEVWIRLGEVGVPHLVVLVEDVAKVDLDARGRELRFHPALGVGGANVNFVSRIPVAHSVDPLAPTWAVRTYERGVEGETLACGTGTVAAGLALATTGTDHLPLRFASASGRTLIVNASVQGVAANEIWLCGEGRLVSRGVWFPV